MSAYHRLISYIYPYEGGIKGKNTGFAKLETRELPAGFKSASAVSLRAAARSAYTFWQGQEEIRIGTLFVRGGNGEFRAVVNCENIEGSGCNMEECCGLTLHETDSAWRAYTTVWEDAVAHAAEVELADVTAEKVREQEAEKEEAMRKQAENVSGEVNSASVGKEKLDEASELTRSGEMENQDTSTETEKKEAVNINENGLRISQPQPEKAGGFKPGDFRGHGNHGSGSRYLRNIRSSRGRSCSGNANGNTARKFSGIQSGNANGDTARKVFSIRNPNGDTAGKFSGIQSEAQTEARRKDSQESTQEVRKKCLRFSTRPSKRHFSQTLKIKNNRNQIHPRNFRKKIPLSPSGTVCVLPIPK